MGQNKRKLGGSYEDQAASFLQKQGLLILEHNFRCKRGEIDLIARDGRYLVFVEVKYRGFKCTGSALEAVDLHKQRMICKAAEYYLLTKCHSFEVPCRFDVVGFDGEQIHWIQDAFDFVYYR